MDELSCTHCNYLHDHYTITRSHNSEIKFVYYNNRKDYNQIANFVYTQSEINIKIKDKAPKEYMNNMKEQIEGNGNAYGNIDSMEALRKNLAENCVPEEFMGMDVSDYVIFLDVRRRMMARYIRDYYKGLA